jgi:hypothetical protein
MNRGYLRDREINAGLQDTLEENEVETALSAPATLHVSATDHAGLARDISLLSIAVDLMADLFDQLQGFRDDDAALDRDLMIEGHLISAQIVEAQEVVSQLHRAADGSHGAKLMAHAKVILGPLGQKLDSLAGYLDRRAALVSKSVSIESELFGEWLESSQSIRTH